MTSERVVITILMALLLIALPWGFSVGMGRHIDTQNVMLCESAKKSGNIEYLKKCERYYETGNINSGEL